MNDAQALEILKQFIDQAIGQGLFKSYEMVTTAMAALDQLRVSVQQKGPAIRNIPTPVDNGGPVTGKKK
jgi:hypothetical protein